MPSPPGVANNDCPTTIALGKPVSSAWIGDALNITGQTAGKRARTRRLAVTAPPPMTPERYQQLVTEGVRLPAQLGRGPR